MNVISAVIVISLAVIGAAAVVRELALRLFCGKSESTVMYITHIKADSENVEQALRSALAKQRWGGSCVSAVCVDAALDEKSRRICETVCRDYGYETLLTKEEFLKADRKSVV